jgi:ketopantoate hydroxymethyltransferase
VSEAALKKSAFGIIFEAVPATVGLRYQKLRVPTISIGGGPGCGPLLVTYDVLAC